MDRISGTQRMGLEANTRLDYNGLCKCDHLIALRKVDDDAVSEQLDLSLR